MHSRRLHYAATALVILGLTFVGLSQIYGLPGANAGSGVSYYVDCASGNDGNKGTSQGAAWKTIQQANKANLVAGDSLLLKRGCTWQGPLNARWNGTASQPILIGAYGSGDLPHIKNAKDGQVKITGSYQVIEYVKATTDANAYDSMAAGCSNQPVGWRVGFNFVDGHHNTLRHSLATGLSLGVNFNQKANHNRVLNNRIVNNYGMWNVRSTQGGTGVLLHGNANEVAYNHFEGNSTRCWDESVAIELFSATNSNVHHNTVFGDKVFVEMGSGTIKSADNTFAYNAHVTNRNRARFVVTRGEGHMFGPVLRTTLFDNSVYHTAGNSQGVICENCGTNILTMRNNIISVQEKALYVGPGQKLNESHNIYWRTGGLPLPNHFIQNFSIDKSSKVVDPQYVNPGANDLRVKPGSPAINAGANASLSVGYTVDLLQASVPQGGAVDVGAHESGGAAREVTGPEPVAAEPVIPSEAAIPGKFEVENYRLGGQGVGFNDTTLENLGGEYRGDAVDIQTTSDAGGGFDVGWIDAGEWLAYDVNVAKSANYVFSVRVASPNDGKSFRIELNGVNVTGSLAVPNTGGTQNWTDVSSGPVNLAGGRYTLKIVAETDGFNLNYVNVTEAAAKAAWETVYALPGRFEAENYRAGGPGVGFNDTTPENLGGEYRTDAVDIQTTTDSGGGYIVGWPAAGEWLAYDVSVAKKGSYAFTVRVASIYDGRSFHIELNGANITGSVVVPNTGGWQAWTNVTTAPVSINAGSYTLKIVSETEGYNVNYVEVSEAASVAASSMSVASEDMAEASSEDAEATEVEATSTEPAEEVPAESVNAAPTAAFTHDCVELTCSFDGSGSLDPDGDVAGYSWDFGDGTAGSGAAVNHLYAPGAYAVTLTVIDGGGESNSISQEVTIAAAAEAENTKAPAVVQATSMHVADLDGSSVSSDMTWTAEVLVTVHDGNDQPVADATVSGYWIDRSSAEVSCTTDADGTCVIKKEGILKLSQIVFTVSDVSHASLGYDADANNVPEGDDKEDDHSDGTSILVNR